METLIVFGRTIGLTEEDFAESQVDIAGLDVAEGLVRLREVALAKERLPRQMTLQMFEQMLYRYQSNMRAMNVYHGGSYEGETMLVLAADEPSSRTAPHSSDQWELFISPEKITRHEVTGHHDSMIYPPHVQKIVTLAGAFFSQDAD